MNRAESARLLTDLKAVWPERTIQADAIDAYHGAWKDLAFLDVAVAVKAWIQAEKWFPSPSEIRARTLATTPAMQRPKRDWGLGACDVCGELATLYLVGTGRWCDQHAPEADGAATAVREAS